MFFLCILLIPSRPSILFSTVSTVFCFVSQYLHFVAVCVVYCDMTKCTINDTVFLLPLQFSLSGYCYEFLCIQSHQILLALSHRNI